MAQDLKAAFGGIKLLKANAASKKARLNQCRIGKHRAHPTSIIEERGLERGRCRDCGSYLMRVAQSRQWTFCGTLGGSIK